MSLSAEELGTLYDSLPLSLQSSVSAIVRALAGSKTSKRKPLHPSTSPQWALTMADLLATSISADLGLSTDPKQSQRWAIDIDRLHRIDGAAQDDIKAAIQWATQDEFWAGNVQSGKALRKHFKRLLRGARKSSGVLQRTRGDHDFLQRLKGLDV